jgi:hypothetical protein
MKAIFSNRSICQCGYSILKDDIPLGTEYDITPGTEESGTLICGGCGKHTSVTLIQVAKRFRSHGGVLPKEIFSISKPV